jgi:hypothetical protein
MFIQPIPFKNFQKKILAFCRKNNKLNKEIPLQTAEFLYDKIRHRRILREKDKF